jgi:flagellar biogenesis protein FliO
MTKITKMFLAIAIILAIAETLRRVKRAFEPREDRDWWI